MKSRLDSVSGLDIFQFLLGVSGAIVALVLLLFAFLETIDIPYVLVDSVTRECVRIEAVEQGALVNKDCEWLKSYSGKYETVFISPQRQQDHLPRDSF